MFGKDSREFAGIFSTQANMQIYGIGMKPKKIGIFHFQVGGTDGVSLEIEKWKAALEEMGHTCYLCAGDLGTAEGTLIREMFHHLPESERLYMNTFVRLSDFDQEGYQAELERMTGILVEHFRGFIKEKKIDLLLVQNIWCVAANPAVAKALETIRREFDLPAVSHNHDFYWERLGALSLTCRPAIDLADKYLPPHNPKIKHAVINSLAQAELLERKGIQSLVVPNVFDFESPPWKQDEYNRDLRTEIGLRENDLVILQATRIVSRKGIELAIDFTRALGTSDRRSVLVERGLYDNRKFSDSDRIVLVLAGYTRDDLTAEYKNKLIEKADHGGVELVFIEDRIAAQRGMRDDQKVYSLWDAYSAADLVTYPSIWEGWGNQFLEAIKAKLPIVLFEYPVYVNDIKPKGFKIISLGNKIRDYDEAGLSRIDEEVIESAADQALEALINSSFRLDVVDHNYSLARKHYSLTSLGKYLNQLFSD